MSLNLLLQSSGQEWQFNIATEITRCQELNLTLLLTSSGQEWQFHIATDIYWSRMAIWHCYWHLVVMIGNFTLLLKSCGHTWHFHIATDIYWSRMAISKSRHQEWQFHIATNMQWSRMAVWLLDVCSSVKLPFWPLDVSNVKLPFLTTRCQ